MKFSPQKLVVKNLHAKASESANSVSLSINPKDIERVKSLNRVLEEQDDELISTKNTERSIRVSLHAAMNLEFSLGLRTVEGPTKFRDYPPVKMNANEELEFTKNDLIERTDYKKVETFLGSHKNEAVLFRLRFTQKDGVWSAMLQAEDLKFPIHIQLPKERFVKVHANDIFSFGHQVIYSVIQCWDGEVENKILKDLVEYREPEPPRTTQFGLLEMKCIQGSRDPQGVKKGDKREIRGHQGEVIQIGRSTSCKFQILDDVISSNHAKLVLTKERGWCLVDESRHGTYFYTQTLDQYYKGKKSNMLILKNKDQFRIGAFVFEVRIRTP